jgi:hypothetical protein
LLRPFKITPKPIWPVRRAPDSKSYRGYLRAWFEDAWAAYCSSGVTPSQPSEIIKLPGA